MKITIIAIVITVAVLYFLMGIILFSIAVNQLGGKEEYIEFLKEKKKVTDARSIYAITKFMFVIFWPMFVHRSKGDKK